MLSQSVILNFEPDNAVTSYEELDKQALSQLYIDHQPWLHQWLCRKLGCSYQAADLAQDAFIKLLTQQHQKLREPRAYLQVLAQRTLFDFWRRKELEQSYSQMLLTQEQSYYPSEETRALVIEAINQLDQLLYRLDVVTRQVFLLSQLRQFTYQEIAEQMAISVMTVRRHMKKAILACVST
ncbi:sigma-70 family RNA polymerase sigma factor [Colwellia asteriadis]|uniref:Sigma-70 family RNA polymerase sigma factor n=1 Tax=Colwellia asteriadis TaxID=517723 RepID=A0ABN1L3T4_9GAMM